MGVENEEKVSVLIPPMAEPSLLLFDSDLKDILSPRLVRNGKSIEVSGSVKDIKELADLAEHHTNPNWCVNQSERQACMVVARRCYEAIGEPVPPDLQPRKRRSR